jgi:hypothetical protein
MLARLQIALIISSAAGRIQFRVSGNGGAEKRPGIIPGLFLKTDALRAHAFAADAAGVKGYRSRRIETSS